MSTEGITPAGQDLKDFVESAVDMGFSMDRATVREVVRSLCGQKRPGRILANITEFTKTGVETPELGFRSYNDLAEADQAIHLIRE